MSRCWVVDASNVVGSRPDGWWRDRPGALARLLDEVTRWRATIADDVVVVVDGAPSTRVPEGTLDGVEVRFAHSVERDAADDEIVRFVGGGPGPSRITVVTSDRGLRDRVRRLGAEVEGAGAFLTRVADIDARRRDRAVLAELGVDESARLGRGGEARVFALGRDRVVRLPHPGADGVALERRRQVLQAIGAAAGPVAVPEVIEHREVHGRLVVIERRLPGRNALEMLGDSGPDRSALIRDHLEVARRITELPCPTEAFGELYGSDHITAPSFAEWADERLGASLDRAGPAFGDIDARRLTAELVAALPEPEPSRPMLVHLDAFLGNMLAAQGRITALLDFGPMTIGGPADLDAAVAVAYLAPEITPTATAADRAIAHAWAEEAGLSTLLRPAERWIAAYWSWAVDDQRLERWCRRTLLDA